MIRYDIMIYFDLILFEILYNMNQYDINQCEIHTYVFTHHEINYVVVYILAAFNTL